MKLGGIFSQCGLVCRFVFLTRSELIGLFLRCDRCRGADVHLPLSYQHSYRELIEACVASLIAAV